VLIKEIRFEGNKAYDSETLKDLIKTEEKGFFSWLTSSGDLDHEVLDQDVSKIAAHYHNHGYIQAKVAEPQLTYDFDMNGVWVWLADQGGPLRGVSWTPDTSEWPSGGDASLPVLLSEILLTIGPEEPYWLSPKACQGILRRARRRGKTVPAPLEAALEFRASQDR